MILTTIYSMLSIGEIWNPVDLFKVDMPEHLKEQRLQKAVKHAVRFLEAQGLKAPLIIQFLIIHIRKIVAFLDENRITTSFFIRKVEPLF